MPRTGIHSGLLASIKQVCTVWSLMFPKMAAIISPIPGALLHCDLANTTPHTPTRGGDISSPLYSALALWTVLSNEMWQKWCVSSKAGSSCHVRSLLLCWREIRRESTLKTPWTLLPWPSSQPNAPREWAQLMSYEAEGPSGWAHPKFQMHRIITK